MGGAAAWLRPSCASWMRLRKRAAASGGMLKQVAEATELVWWRGVADVVLCGGQGVVRRWQEAGIQRGSDRKSCKEEVAGTPARRQEMASPAAVFRRPGGVEAGAAAPDSGGYSGGASRSGMAWQRPWKVVQRLLRHAVELGG